MSGQIKKFSLEEILRPGIAVVSVNIIGHSFATVSEIKKAENNPSDNNAGRFGFYKAKVNENIEGSLSQDASDEKWTIEYAEPDRQSLRNIKKTDIQQGDTIALFNNESIRYSYMYYVENLHKIFYYNRCDEIVKEVKNGKNYLFITHGSYSKKNMAFYGAIESGLIDDTPENRSRVAAICKGKL